jgi:hypothetical protein
MSNLERRRNLFRLYSAQVSFYAPQHKGLFLGPICGTRFGPEAVESDTLQVDLAHVYPKSVGGKLETLACCKCNSTMGTKFDSQIAVEHRLQNAMGRGTDSIPARMDFDGGSVGGRVSRSGKSWHFEMVESWSKREHVEALTECFAGLPRWAVRTYERIDNPRHNAAILCAAYLNLFREYGYEYVAFADARCYVVLLCAVLPHWGHSFWAVRRRRRDPFGWQHLFFHPMSHPSARGLASGRARH